MLTDFDDNLNSELICLGSKIADAAKSALESFNPTMVEAATEAIEELKDTYTISNLEHMSSEAIELTIYNAIGKALSYEHG